MNDWDDGWPPCWILDAEHRPVKVTMAAWSRWFANFGNRRVAVDQTRFFEVSTVFLGLNHQWGKGPPLLFETMVFEREATIKELFGGRLFPARASVDQWRYASWDDAEAGHKAIVKRLKREERQAEKAAPG